MPFRPVVLSFFVLAALPLGADVPASCESDIELTLVAGRPGFVSIRHIQNTGLGMVHVDWRGARTSFIPAVNPHEIQLDLTCLLTSETVTVTPSRCAIEGHPRSLAIPPPDLQPVLDAKTTPEQHKQVEIRYTMPYASGQRRMRAVFLGNNDVILDTALGLDSGEVSAAVLGPEEGPVLVRAISCGAKEATETVNTGGDTDCNDDCKDKCEAPPQCVGTPINTAGRNMRFEDHDPLPGYTLRRVYDSRSNVVGFFGARWFSPFDAKLKILDDFDGVRFVTITAPDRSWMVFRRRNGIYQQIGPGRAQDASLVELTDGNWRQTLAGGREAREFNAGGKLVAIRDVRTGRETRFVWNAALPIRIDDSWGNWSLDVTADQATRRILQIAVAGRPDLVWRYTQDDHLQRVDSPIGVWRTYTYAAPGYPYDRYRLTVARDGAGNLIESHSYPDDSGRSTTSYAASGGIDAVEFAEGRNPGETATRVRYQNGRTEMHYHRSVAGKWRTVEVTNACASCGRRVQSVVYDGYANVVRAQDADGYITTNGYDSSGLRKLWTLTAQRPETCDPATAPNHCHLTTDALAAAALVPTEATQAISYAYDPNWRDRVALTITDSVLAPGQTRREMVTFDPSTGEVLTQTTIGWTGIPATQVTRTTVTSLYSGTEGAAFAPDGSFLASWLSLPQPRRPKSVNGPRTDVLDVTSFVYYPIDSTVPAPWRGQLAAVRNALGHTTRYENYDEFGNARRVIDANGVVVDTTYDAIGRRTMATTRGVPNCDTSVDPLCNTDIATIWNYSAAGPLASMQQPHGGVTTYGYDARGRIATISRGPSVVDLREQMATSYDDGTGKKNLERFLARENGAWVEKRRIAYHYDLAEALDRVTFADGATIAYEYDAGGRLVAQRDENHAATFNNTYEYDIAGRLRRVQQMLGSGVVTTRYVYDLQGNLTSVTDPAGNVTRHTFDDFGQMLRQESPVTGTTLYTYDTAGELLSTSHEGTSNRTTRAYDVLGRAISATTTQPGRSTESISWTYDAGTFGKGRMSRMQLSIANPNAGRTSTITNDYAWERRGLLLSETESVNSEKYTTRYQYDGEGNRSRMTYPSGRAVDYGFDFASRPFSAVTSQTTLVSGARYLPFGPLEEISFGNGTTRAMSYDERYQMTTNRLTGLLQGETGPPALQTIASYVYGHDPAGNITSIADLTNSLYTRSFSYDDLHRLVTANGPWGAGSYSYDAIGNLRTSAVGANLQTFTRLGTTAKLASVVKDGRVETVTYDAAGNETAVGNRNYDYSARNHLTAAGGRTFQYDARGLRTTTTYSITLTGFSLATSTASPNQTFTGRVALNEPAPAGGIIVRLTSSSRFVDVPRKVTIAAGQIGATFAVTIGQNAHTGTVTLTATFATTLTKTIAIVDTPPLSTFTASPVDVVGGNPIAVAVTLAGPAPDGGADVVITSDQEAVSGATINIGGGRTAGSATLTTNAVPSSLTVRLTARYGGSTLQTTVQLRPVTVPDRLLLTPDGVGGGERAVGTITLAAPAAAGGRTFTLASSNPAVAQVPSSVVIAAGAQSAAFPITTSPVTGATTVTITAADPAVTLQATLNVACRMSRVASVTPVAGETIIIDDVLPPAAAINGSIGWDPTQSAGGGFSLSAPFTGSGVHQASIAGLGEPISPTEKLFAYALVSECARPREILLRGKAGGAWVTAYWGDALWGVGADAINMGPVPASGSWIRLDLLLRDPFADGDPIVSDLELAYVDGKVWFDRIGRTTDCATPVAARPTLPNDDDVLIDEALPAGVTLENVSNGPLRWSSPQAVSGARSLVHPNRGFGTYVTGVAGLAQPLVSGARLSVYVLVDPCSPPVRQIHLRITTTGGTRTISWGEPLWDVDATTSQRGAVPAAGVWTRLEIPLDQLGLDAGTLTRIDIAHVNGRVWFDRIAVWPLTRARLTGFTSDHDTSAVVGTTVTWTATATGTVYPLQYRFERRNDLGVWSVVQNYGPANTYTWTPIAADAGLNAVRVSVRNAGSGADFEDTATLPLRVYDAGGERLTADVLFTNDPRRARWFAPRGPVSLGVDAAVVTNAADAPVRRHSLYSPELQLLAETEITTASKPPIQYEYVWFAGQPLAQITTATAEVAWYFNDHLGTPILQTAADGGILWRAEYDPYGTVISHRTGADKHQPLRFPGQENDGSTELTYNIFRWYRAGWGRYTQADPILAALNVISTRSAGGTSHWKPVLQYSYAAVNPISNRDRTGLQFSIPKSSYDDPSEVWLCWAKSASNVGAGWPVFDETRSYDRSRPTGQLRCSYNITCRPVEELFWTGGPIGGRAAILEDDFPSPTNRRFSYTRPNPTDCKPCLRTCFFSTVGNPYDGIPAINRWHCWQ
jgi:RHS repeat-associated protein